MTSTLRSLSLSLAVFVFGCASREVTDPTSGQAAVSEPTAPPLTLENWQGHPSLEDIARLRLETHIAQQNELWESASKADLCPGPGEKTRTKLTHEGRIRSLAVRSESDRAVSTLRAIYDVRGKLRFVETTLRTPGGTGEDHLVFFGVDGRVVWEVIADHRPGPDGLPTPGPWRRPHPVDVDPFDTFAFDDPGFVSAPELVFEQEPLCHGG